MNYRLANPFQVRTTAMPRAGRLLWWHRFGPALAFIPVWGVTIIFGDGTFFGGHGDLKWTLLIAAGLVEAFIIFLGWQHIRRLRSKAIQTGGRMCTTCGYDLIEASEHCTCTECGAPNHLPEAIRAWTEWGFRPFDAQNPAPDGIERKFRRLIAASIIFVAVTPIGVYLWLALDQYIDPREDSFAEVRAFFIYYTAISSAIFLVSLAWISISLWHKWKSRKLRRRHAGTLRACPP